MRIAFFGGFLSRRASGVREVVEGLSRSIADRGHEVRVFGLEDQAWLDGDRNEWLGAPAEVLRSAPPHIYGFMRGARSRLDAFDPDVVHVHGLWRHASRVGASWAERSGGTLVISPHGMLSPVALGYSPVKKRIAALLFQDRCLTQANALHATSEAEAHDINGYLGNVPIANIPIGVEDTQVSLPRWQDRAHRVLAIGRLHPVKGYDRLLRAWAQVETAFPNWSLEIAGPDPVGHGDTLRKLAVELNLTRARVTPPIYGSKRDALIADSRLFALPSLTENFALTVPEALVCATPVIASTGSPWGALPQQGCGWWTAPEPDALAQAMRQAMALPDDQLAAMGARGRFWALEQFGWNRIAARMTNFYTSLNGSPP